MADAAALATPPRRAERDVSGGAEASAARVALVELLQLAYSGERAAALAYRGHGRSLRDPRERERVATIEREEWHHRDLVGGILSDLGAAPDPARERRARLVGTVIGAACHVIGWFAAMYGAGRLESRNIREYETAARHAERAGLHRHVPCLLDMAEVEWEHESWFRQRVESHPLSRLVRPWPAPPPKRHVRDSFEAERAGRRP